MTNVTTNAVYRTLNKLLTFAGVERRLFFLAVGAGVGAFNLFASLLCGLLLFAALYSLALWATTNDPQALRILLNSSRFKALYDPAKWEVNRL